MPWKFPPQFPGRRAPSTPPAPDSPSPADARATAPHTPVFLARQPIFDAAERVMGYELLLRPSAVATPRPPAKGEEEVSLVLDTLTRFGVERALGDRIGFLRLSPEALASDLVELIPKTRFVLEYAAWDAPDEAMATRLSSLRARGFRLARLCRGAEAEVVHIANTADLVIYDLAERSLQDIVRLDRLVKSQNLQRLVRNVNRRADFDACRTFGFDLYQGGMFAHPETQAIGRLDPSRMRVIEIFNLVINRADVGEIEAAFKHDVALCYSLLCYINSAGIGLQYKVSSIRDAVMLLGYDFLWRWLSLLIFAGVDLTAAQRALLNTALVRARLAELLGQARLGSREGNLLFLTGMFSLLDALLGLPLAEVTARLHLPADVCEALLTGSGRYAAYLQLATAFEEDDAARAAHLCEALQIDLDQASQAHLAAIEWAGLLAK